jgi:hypothetical protein
MALRCIGVTNLGEEVGIILQRAPGFRKGLRAITIKLQVYIP